MQELIPERVYFTAVIARDEFIGGVTVPTINNVLKKYRINPSENYDASEDRVNDTVTIRQDTRHILPE